MCARDIARSVAGTRPVLKSITKCAAPRRAADQRSGNHSPVGQAWPRAAPRRAIRRRTRPGSGCRREFRRPARRSRPGRPHRQRRRIARASDRQRLRGQAAQRRQALEQLMDPGAAHAPRRASPRSAAAALSSSVAIAEGASGRGGRLSGGAAVRAHRELPRPHAAPFRLRLRSALRRTP